ncbi:MAG TPA: PPOX class F420-dependent oxidoreductase [Actinomycetes bacterium]|nr:PPOX class F420-dependent oxidoreductase [Actinomycetes bacterium]
MTIQAPADTPIPPSHLDLLTAPIVGVLTTLMPDGQPHSCLVWVDHDGECARINTTLERRSGRNLKADRRLSLLVVDPENTSRYLHLRGDAELVRRGAIDHLDALTRKYTGHPCFYGHVYPQEQRERETRVTVRLHAHRVTLDAIHT